MGETAVKTGLRNKFLTALGVAVMLGAAAPESPVADAAMRGDREAVRTLLQEGADVNAAHGDGMTALHWAAERRDAEMAELLIYAGANVEAVTRIAHYTPLHIASKAGSVAVIEHLLKAGSDVHATTGSGGATALHLAAVSGGAEAVSALLKAGSDVNAREAEWGQTPLIFAASFGRTDVVKVLLANGADPSLTSKTLDYVEQSRRSANANRRRGSDPAQAEPTPGSRQGRPGGLRDGSDRRGRGRG